MLKKILLLLAAFYFTSAASSAQAAPPPTCKGANVYEEIKSSNPELGKEIASEAAKFPNGKAIFWRIEKDGLPASYLLGTVHVTDPRIHGIPDPVLSAFNSSRLLILEAVNLSDTAMAQAMMKVMPQSMFNPAAGETLKDYLTADEMAFAVKMSAGMGLPKQVVNLVKPWLVAIALALPPCEQNRAKAGLKSLDAKLEDMAKKTSKPAIGLETPEEQLGAMASIPLDAQVAWLKNSIELYPRSEDFFETMIQLYLKRDLGVMIPLSIKVSKNPELAKTAMESFQKRLIVKRNKLMVDRAKAELDKGGAFMAVGALHLGGQEGIVDLLQKAGYKVTPAE